MNKNKPKNKNENVNIWGYLGSENICEHYEF